MLVEPGDAVSEVPHDNICSLFVAFRKKLCDGQPWIHMVLVHVSVQNPIVL